jgi:hypothetical protein
LASFAPLSQHLKKQQDVCNSLIYTLIHGGFICVDQIIVTYGQLKHRQERGKEGDEQHSAAAAAAAAK